MASPVSSMRLMVNGRTHEIAALPETPLHYVHRNDLGFVAEADARAPGFVAHVPGGPGSPDSDAWVAFSSGFVAAFPDLRLTVEDSVAAGDKVAAGTRSVAPTRVSSRVFRRPGST